MSGMRLRGRGVAAARGQGLGSALVLASSLIACLGTSAAKGDAANKALLAFYSKFELEAGKGTAIPGTSVKVKAGERALTRQLTAEALADARERLRREHGNVWLDAALLAD
eukprot:COSAG04_NODE_1273_length_7466_cov_76.544319_7_plen_111_part_00